MKVSLRGNDEEVRRNQVKIPLPLWARFAGSPGSMAVVSNCNETFTSGVAPTI